MGESGLISCPKCGLELETGTAICPTCDFIIDSSFLGDDILDEIPRQAADFAPKETENDLSKDVKPSPKAEKEQGAKPAKRTRPLKLPKKPFFADEDDEDSEISKSAASHRRKKSKEGTALLSREPGSEEAAAAKVSVSQDKIRGAKKGSDVDFGEDAIILGNMEDEFSSFATDHSGMHREVTQARIYVGAKTSELLRNDAILQKISGLSKRTSILTPYEEHALSFINGKRPVGRIRRKSGMLETELKLALAMLADKGVVKLKGHITKAQKERAKERRIQKNAVDEAIQRENERLAPMEGPDAAVEKAEKKRSKDASKSAKREKTRKKKKAKGKKAKQREQALKPSVTALIAEPLSFDEDNSGELEDVFAEGTPPPGDGEMRSLWQETSLSFKRQAKEAPAVQHEEAGFADDKETEQQDGSDLTLPTAPNTADAGDVFAADDVAADDVAADDVAADDVAADDVAADDVAADDVAADD
ncbi:MAG: hypothetical protein GY822_04240, partial [Deltaproteobacteria bacterium]|nr:hypothetical protein [Deltaproteobacteria bacterium]